MAPCCECALVIMRSGGVQTGCACVLMFCEENESYSLAKIVVTIFFTDIVQKYYLSNQIWYPLLFGIKRANQEAANKS